MAKKTDVAELRVTMYHAMNALCFVLQTMEEETPAPDLHGEEFALEAGALARRMEYFTSTLWCIQQDLEHVQAELDKLEEQDEH